MGNQLILRDLRKHPRVAQSPGGIGPVFVRGVDLAPSLSLLYFLPWGGGSPNFDTWSNGSSPWLPIKNGTRLSNMEPKRASLSKQNRPKLESGSA